MTTEKLAAGATASWTALMTTELNALASGNAILGSTAVDNGTNLDLEVEFSFIGGGSVTTTGNPGLALYIVPQNGDASTYGDGRFGTAAAGPPPQNYFAGQISLIARAGTITGTFTRPDAQGTFIRTPRGLWKPLLYSFAGVSFPASGNVLYYRTTNLQFV